MALPVSRCPQRPTDGTGRTGAPSSARTSWPSGRSWPTSRPATPAPSWPASPCSPPTAPSAAPTTSPAQPPPRSAPRTRKSPRLPGIPLTPLQTPDIRLLSPSAFLGKSPGGENPHRFFWRTFICHCFFLLVDPTHVYPIGSVYFPSFSVFFRWHSSISQQRRGGCPHRMPAKALVKHMLKCPTLFPAAAVSVPPTPTPSVAGSSKRAHNREPLQVTPCKMT